MQANNDSQECITLSKRQNRTPISDPEGTEIYELSDESKIAFINSANFKKNTMKQLNKIREPIIKRRNMTDPKK